MSPIILSKNSLWFYDWLNQIAALSFVLLLIFINATDVSFFFQMNSTCASRSLPLVFCCSACSSWCCCLAFSSWCCRSVFLLPLSFNWKIKNAHCFVNKPRLYCNTIQVPYSAHYITFRHTWTADVIIFFSAAIINISSDAYLLLCTGEFELQVGCLLLTVLQLLPRQLPLFLQTTLHFTQLPLCLQQFGVQLGRVREREGFKI